MEAKNRKKKGTRKFPKLLKVFIAIFLFFLFLYLWINIVNNRTLSSLQKINDYPFYTMTYEGDYPLALAVNLQNIVLSGMLKKDSVRQGMHMEDACTCFMSSDQNGGYLYGRNLDYFNDCIALLLFTKPENRYASVSMVDLAGFGYSSKTSILGSRLPDSRFIRTRLLLAPYAPRDGMNECGLVVSTLNVPRSEVMFDKGKKTVARWQATRLMLDYAANVDEAIALFEEYNLYSGSSGVHYLIADASGNSAIVEFLDGKMEVVRNKDNWQVASNFNAAGSEALGEGKDRFEKANDYLKNAQGSISQEEAMTILQMVAQSHTVWSSIYNMATGDISISVGRDYHNVFTDQLTMKRPLQ